MGLLRKMSVLPRPLYGQEAGRGVVWVSMSASHVDPISLPCQPDIEGGHGRLIRLTWEADGGSLEYGWQASAATVASSIISPSSSIEAI